MNALFFLLLAFYFTYSRVQCSPLQLVPLEDEIQDALHNTHFVLSLETTTTSRSVQSQMEEFLSIDHKPFHVNTTLKTDENVTDNKNISSIASEDNGDFAIHSRSNASWSLVDDELGIANSSSKGNGSNDDVNMTGTQDNNLFPDEVKEHPNGTIAISGLNDDGESSAVLINESSNNTHDVHHDLKPIKKLKGDNRPSVLDFHPILNKSGDQTIRFHAGVPEEWHPYTKSLSTFLEPYDKVAQTDNAHCDFERTLGDDQACRFDLVYLGPSCTKQNNFGYGIGKPCILFSPAKIADWVPTPFDNESTSIPDEVHRLMRIFNSNFMFVTCEGESESDRTNIGPMAYLPPYQGFPSYFFPYKGDTVPSYVAPLMAVEFLNPTNGTLITVVCRAWARNLPDLPRQTSLRFSLQVN